MGRLFDALDTTPPLYFLGGCLTILLIVALTERMTTRRT